MGVQLGTFDGGLESTCRPCRGRVDKTRGGAGEQKGRKESEHSVLRSSRDASEKKTKRSAPGTPSEKAWMRARDRKRERQGQREESSWVLLFSATWPRTTSDMAAGAGRTLLSPFGNGRSAVEIVLLDRRHKDATRSRDATLLVLPTTST